MTYDVATPTPDPDDVVVGTGRCRFSVRDDVAPEEDRFGHVFIVHIERPEWMHGDGNGPLQAWVRTACSRYGLSIGRILHFGVYGVVVPSCIPHTEAKSKVLDWASELARAIEVAMEQRAAKEAAAPPEGKAS